MRILFIGHEASRTGAPMILLHYQRWIKENTTIEFNTIFLKGGELLSDFKALGNVRIIPKRSIRANVFSLFNRSLTKQEVLVRYSIGDFVHGIDLIYVNSVLSLQLGSIIKSSIKPKCKLITHVHELNIILERYVPNFADLMHDSDHFIAVSDLVKRNLINHGVDRQKIDVVYEFSGKRGVCRNGRTKEFVIGGSGTVHWRKGVDAFLMVAKYCRSYFPDFLVRFQWIGKIPEIERSILEHDLSKMGLNDMVHFTDLLDDPSEMYATFDLFLMTSREDPFPLVCIEVGQMGIPIICFEGATGTEEILKEGGGRIVDYFDIRGMSEAIFEYAGDSELYEKHSLAASKAFRRFLPDIICPELNKIVMGLEE